MPKPPTRLSLFAALLVLWGASGGTLFALSVTVPTFTELVTKSEQIVRGEVIRVESRQVTNAAGFELIKTFVTIRSDEMPKGLPDPEITLSFLGGTVAGETLTVPGMPTFQKGDRGWFFVTGNGHSLCPLISGPYGAYREVKDPTSAALRVVRYDRSVMTSPEAIERPSSNGTDLQARFAAVVTPDVFRAAIYRELGRLGLPSPQIP
jgi:hypothetical protein